MANPAKHGPCGFRAYMDIHNAIMARYRAQGFVLEDRVRIESFGRDVFMLGPILCKGQIIVRVEKILEFVDPPGTRNRRIQTFQYCYNVSTQGAGEIFRYANVPHKTPHAGHPDPHYKRVYDWPRNREVDGSPFWIGELKWPTLEEVLREVQDWHAAHYSALPDPEGIATSYRES